MTAGFDPAEASIVWNSPIYTTGSVKYSSTATNRIYIEAGASTNYERYNTIYQPGLSKTPFSPEWYTVINKNDSAKGTQWGAGATNQGMYPDRFAAMGAVSYVTGTHNIKVGVQDTWGRYRQYRSANGDLRATFINGVASTVTILNTPVNFQDNLKADLGIYGQDSWTFNRLTINYGARWEYFASGIPEETSGTGRFVTSTRSFGPIDMPTWTSFAPRGGFVYDLFGNQKTALKFSIGRYEQAGTTGFSNRFNPLALLTQSVAWSDLNKDGVPQGELGCVYLSAGCEMNLAGQLPKNFGVASLPTFDPNIERMYNLETTVSVQHEIMTRRVGHRRAGTTASTRTCGGGRTPASASPTSRRSRFSVRSTARRSPTTTSARRKRRRSASTSWTPTRRTAPTSTTGSSTTSICACRTTSRCSAAA